MVFKPGASAEHEGNFLWLGNNQGDLQEVDLQQGRLIDTLQGAHGRCDVVKMHRYQNTVWSIDDEGKLLVWLPDESAVPSFDVQPDTHRVAKGHTFSIIARDLLWLATGKELRIYDPVAGHESEFHVTPQALVQPGTGDVTSGAVLSGQLERVYFGHSDGKVTVYSTKDYSCLGVYNVSAYKITTLAGVGHQIWAGFSTGAINVYDTRPTPWRITKEWKAHEGPVASIIVDRSSVWKFGHLQIVSLGLDNAIRFWDGMLEEDWLEREMQDSDDQYCDFREIKTVVVTWNAGASTPGMLRYDERDNNFFREVIQADEPPDILVFGFQELVDLEDKSLTAKSLIKSHTKKHHEQEHVGHAHRAWRDFLVRLLEESMPPEAAYTVLHTSSLVGLFQCVFVQSALRGRVRDLQTVEVKRGLGGLYGNKGALITRFVLDSSSLCFANCHLAAGQRETLARNADAAAILDAAALHHQPDRAAQIDTFVGGGDGSMLLDHEIAVLSGDLNYRIDTMGRDSVVKAVGAGQLDRLLARDQLLVSRRRNPGFRLRAFREDRIAFAPTYKYDVGADRYDSSEKARSPAWCDRVLYRGAGRVRMVEGGYRRHECRMSDHRPVSATFLMRIKAVRKEERERVWREVEGRLLRMKMELAEEVR